MLGRVGQLSMLVSLADGVSLVAVVEVKGKRACRHGGASGC